MGRKKALFVEEPVAGYESQIIEWKESWRDEYLRWICGFANAQGGRLIIGKNDKGCMVGLGDSKKLLVDIPNKIRDILGIVADVNLQQEDGKEYLEIIVEPYPSPVNYRGEYHYRTGSTKQELKGHALDAFLLKPKLGDFLTRLTSIPLFIVLRAFCAYHLLDMPFKALNPLN